MAADDLRILMQAAQAMQETRWNPELVAVFSTQGLTSHCPKLREPVRTSTPTAHIAPRLQCMSLPCAQGGN